MERLTKLQTEFDVRDFKKNDSARQFLDFLHSDKSFKAECNNCEYYIRGGCISSSNICTYKRKSSLSEFYTV